MVVTLPPRLHAVFCEKRKHEIRVWRGAPNAGAAPHIAVDRRLLARMADAIDAGLHLVDVCKLEDYAGPHLDLVRQAEHLSDSATSHVPSSSGGSHWSRLGVASAVVEEEARARPDALVLRWLVLGYSVPLCPNDGCAELFEPLVRAHPSAVVWHVAASLFTWSQCGVPTAPLLAETLRRWIATGMAVDRWCRDNEGGVDPYRAFMVNHALRVLDSDAGASIEAEWRARYYELVASSV